MNVEQNTSSIQDRTRRVRGYVKNIFRQASGVAAIEGGRKAKMPDKLPPGSVCDIPKAFQDLKLDTSGLPDPLSIKEKAGAVVVQFSIPALYRALPYIVDTFEKDDSFLGEKIWAFQLFAGTTISDTFTTFGTFSIAGYFAHTGDMKNTAVALGAKVGYNIGIQVIPDGYNVAKRKMRTVFEKEKSALS